MTKPKSKFIQSMGADIHYIEQGDTARDTIVFIHGIRDNCHSWYRFSEQLSQQHHCVCMDLRGHGDSAYTSNATYGAEELLFDLNTLVDALGGRVTIVAHSLGGAIALRYAGMYAEKVTRLITIEAGQPSPQLYAEYHSRTPAQRMRDYMDKLATATSRERRRYTSKQDAIAHYQKQNPRVAPEISRQLAEKTLKRCDDGSYTWKFDPMLYAFRYQSTQGEDRFDYWVKIKCPVLMIYGSESFLPGLDQTGLASIIPDACTAKIKGASHWPQHERAEETLALVRDFL